MPEAKKEPHPWIGKEVMYVNIRPWPNDRNQLEIEPYKIYRVSHATDRGGVGSDLYLENCLLGYKADRFIEVTDWPEADKALNRG